MLPFILCISGAFFILPAVKSELFKKRLNLFTFFCLINKLTLYLMKRVLSILSVVLITIAFSSCKKTYVTPNPNQSILFNVPTTAWTLSTDKRSYYTVISTPEIDSYFNDYGGVLAYFSFDKGVYEQIPEVYNGISYSYTHNAGSVVLYAQSYDGGTPIVPAALTFKLVLLSTGN